MATLNFIKRKDVKNIESLGNVIAYCSQEYKTKYEDSRLISGINCLPETAMKEFIATKKHWNKQDGMQYYYAVQSFEDGLNISPLLAHQMAREWAERCYPNHEIYIATHLDTDNIHSHIVINSVNMKTGYKIHQSTKELNQMRQVNDELCIKYGLPVCVPKQNTKVKPLKAKEYFVANAGKSWKMKMILSIEYAMKRVKTKQQFIEEMDKLGYDIRWTPSRKNITYIEKANPNHKCRDNNLHQEKFLKEKMEEEFEIRERLTSLKREKQTPNFYYGESSFRYDSGERLLESTDRFEQKSESAVEYDRAESSERRYNQSLFGTDNPSIKKENDGAREFDSERVEESGNGTDRTGWEYEREYAFGYRTDEEFTEGTEEEMDSDILWNDNRHSSVLSDTLYFAGDLFKMIDNQTRYHRKKIKLSQKEIEKKLAHGQKSDGYEEFEDYYNNQLTM
ncbi:MAG: relaxase/mobilization nuclease domain-containing protein [Eubacterium sp.]